MSTHICVGLQHIKASIMLANLTNEKIVDVFILLHYFPVLYAKRQKNSLQNYDYKVLIILAGAPATTTLEGTSFVTTLPAPITTLSPMVRGWAITELAPINT